MDIYNDGILTSLTDHSTFIDKAALKSIFQKALQTDHGHFSYTVKTGAYAPTATTLWLQLDDPATIPRTDAGVSGVKFNVIYFDNSNPSDHKGIIWLARTATDPGDGSLAIQVNTTTEWLEGATAIGSGAGEFDLSADVTDTLFRIVYNHDITTPTPADGSLAWVDPTAAPHNATGDGVADDTTEIASADSTAGANGVVYIEAGKTYRITTNTTVVSQFIIDNGGAFTVDAGATLTFSRAPIAPLSFWAKGAGDYAFSTGATIYPEWFGAARDGATDDAAEIQKALDTAATCNGATLAFQQGDYYIGSSIQRTTVQQLKIVGIGGSGGLGARSGTRILANTAIKMFDLGDDANANWAGVEIENIELKDTHATGLVTDGWFFRHMNNMNLHNLNCTDIKVGSAITFSTDDNSKFCQHITIWHPRTVNCKYGIRLASTIADIQVFGGLLKGAFGISIISGSIGIWDEAGGASSRMVVYGTNINDWETGIEINQIAYGRFECILEQSSGNSGTGTAIKLNGGTGTAEGWQNAFINTGIVRWGTGIKIQGEAQISYSGLTGSFQVGETVTTTDGLSASVKSDTGTSMVIETITGWSGTALTLTGGTSGATATLDSITYDGAKQTTIINMPMQGNTTDIVDEGRQTMITGRNAWNTNDSALLELGFLAENLSRRSFKVVGSNIESRTGNAALVAPANTGLLVRDDPSRIGGLYLGSEDGSDGSMICHGVAGPINNLQATTTAAAGIRFTTDAKFQFFASNGHSAGAAIAAGADQVGVIEANGDLDFTGGYRQTLDGWFQDNVPANQLTPTACNRYIASAEKESVMLRAGSVTAIAIEFDATVTAGSATAKVFKNGSLISGTLVTITSGTNLVATFAKDAKTFVAGDKLDARLETTADFLPDGTAKAQITIEIET